MNLFDETENKYYELISYLLNEKGEYSRNEINRILSNWLKGELDFEVTEAIFEAKEGSELIFYEDAGVIKPVMNGGFPIRNSIIENQALKTLPSNIYCHHFLSDETVQKLFDCVKDIDDEWNPDEITIKNTFDDGVTKTHMSYSEDLSIVARAIRAQQAIKYDNIRPGRVEMKSKKAFPVKIEFSVVNDRFRISAYEPIEHRFIKMNLDSLKNIELCEEIAQIDLQEEYREFIKSNMKHVVLDVDPTDHVIERCFRVFSYYDRKARFDRQANKYRLEISYLKSDENEVIKNILSMGSSVLVMEPRNVQKEVYRRIEAASLLY